MEGIKWKRFQSSDGTEKEKIESRNRTEAVLKKLQNLQGAKKAGKMEQTETVSK